MKVVENKLYIMSDKFMIYMGVTTLCIAQYALDYHVGQQRGISEHKKETAGASTSHQEVTDALGSSTLEKPISLEDEPMDDTT